ncbi:MAG: DUF4349 domain-containing protein [Firmicutes bacterium]|nr:DUF4349 domain-containing protein [Bacillota bacterium]
MQSLQAQTNNVRDHAKRWVRSPKAAAVVLACALTAGAIVSYNAHLQSDQPLALASFDGALVANRVTTEAVHGFLQTPSPLENATGTSNTTLTTAASSSLGTTSDGRMIAEEANLNVRVPNVVRAEQGLEASAASVGGFVSSSNQSGTGDSLNAQVQLRIPTADFAAFVRHAGDLGTVLQFSQNGQDVTQTYNLGQAQLTTLRSELAAYTRLFGKARSMKDMLTIQQAIIQVQSQIANLSDQQHSVLRTVALATLWVNLVSPVFDNTAPGPVVTAWNQILASLAQSGLAILTLLAWALPWAASFAIIVTIFRVWQSRRRRVRQ